MPPDQNQTPDARTLLRSVRDFAEQRETETAARVARAAPSRSQEYQLGARHAVANYFEEIAEFIDGALEALASPSLPDSGERERRGDLTLTDGDGDALKLTETDDGRLIAKTVHGGRPDSTRVFLSIADQVRLARYLAPVSSSDGGEREALIPDDEIVVETVAYAHTPGPPDLRTPVRATHKPSGISVICDENRSQLTNKDVAIRRLRLLVAASSSPPAGGDDEWDLDEEQVLEPWPRMRQVLTGIVGECDTVADRHFAALARAADADQGRVARDVEPCRRCSGTRSITGPDFSASGIVPCPACSPRGFARDDRWWPVGTRLEARHNGSSWVGIDRENVSSYLSAGFEVRRWDGMFWCDVPAAASLPSRAVDVDRARPAGGEGDDERVRELEHELAVLAAAHHATVTPSKLHDPESRGWTDCPCHTCARVARILAHSPVSSVGEGRAWTDRSGASSRQRLPGPDGEWVIAVAPHSGAPTFTFDLEVPKVTAIAEGGPWLVTQNMTRDQLAEHVGNCEAALAREGRDAPAREEERLGEALLLASVELASLPEWLELDDFEARGLVAIDQQHSGDYVTCLTPAGHETIAAALEDLRPACEDGGDDGDR